MCYISNMDDSAYEPSRNCSECDELNRKMDAAAHFLEYIVDALYDKKPLDTAMFESNLDELCHYLGVKIKTSEIQIERNKSKWLSDWVVQNNLYLTQLPKAQNQ